jgi:DNA-binding response OmpR family regulator
MSLTTARHSAQLAQTGQCPLCARTRETATVTLPRLRIDLLDRRVWIHDTLVHMSGIEYDILLHLARRPHRVVTRNELLRDVWGYRAMPRNSRSIETSVYRLRRRIRDATGIATYLETVRGIGWRLNEPTHTTN